MKEFQDMLPSAYDEIHGKCSDVTQECSMYYEMFAEMIFGWIRMVNDIATFLSYASAFVNLFLERLKYHNPEAYASAYYDFMTNRQVQLEIEKAIPYGLPLIAQTHEVGFDFVTITEQDDTQSFCIAERFVFTNLFSFLQVDLSRRLMIGHAPKNVKTAGNIPFWKRDTMSATAQILLPAKSLVPADKSAHIKNPPHRQKHLRKRNIKNYIIV